MGVIVLMAICWMQVTGAKYRRQGRTPSGVGVGVGVGVKVKVKVAALSHLLGITDKKSGVQE